MKRYRNIFYAMLMLAAGGVTTSCDSFFNPEMDDMLFEENHYGQRADLEAAFVGIAALFQDVAEKHILIEGLRSDLMVPTAQAPTEIVDVAQYTATNGNDIVDPELFYRTIVGCNDFLRRAIQFDTDHPGVVNDLVMEGMVAEVVRYRAWCYLTIAKIYGEAIYHDYGMSDDFDISSAPLMSLDDIVKTLIGQLTSDFMGYETSNKLNWELITNTESDVWNRVSINHKALLGELYLWDKNNLAAVEILCSLVGEDNSAKRFTLPLFAPGTSWEKFFTDLAASTNEFITVVPFSMELEQQHSLQYYFSKEGTSAYYIKPSDKIVSLFASQVRINNAKGDDRRGVRKSYAVEANDYVIYKYSIERAYYEQDRHIPIYRAGDIHLMLAEALNNLSMSVEALAFVNDGLRRYYSSSGAFKFPFNNPVFSTNLRENAGVRGRVGLKPVLPTATEQAEKQIEIAKIIAQEVALECAFEGKRFYTLVRMARQYNDPTFVADAIGNKFSGEDDHYHTLMMNPEKWFIQYDHLK